MTSETSGMVTDLVTTRTIAQAARDGAARLESVADNPGLEARLLLAHALGVTRNDLVREPGRQIETGHFDALLSRRARHEPLALILGHREFWSLDFLVSAATLIPRPDSETLIEAALVFFAGRPAPRKILDLGTGTGCLLLALLQEFQDAFGIGLDLAPDATALAGANAIRLGLASRSAFLVGDWTDPIEGRFDLIISNPPYIPHGDIDGLMPEVACHEPKRALDGGADGCDAYRLIIPRIRHYLEAEGAAILELGEGQANYVTEIASDAGFQTSIRVDLANNSRGLVLTWPGCQKNSLAGSRERYTIR